VKKERSISKPVTVERQVKITPVRESSKDKRDPTPHEKSVKREDRHDRETKEREDENVRKREKERKREKRPSPPAEFEGDLSSVSNSSTGSIQPNADVVIVEEPRGKC
jgi:hypothetical protein